MVCVDDGCQPHIVSKMKHGISGGQHRRPEGKVYLRLSFPFKVGGIVSPRLCPPYHLEGVLPCGCSSGAMEQLPAKSSASGLPLRWLELPCAIRNASDSQLCHNLPVRSTSLASWQKRRDDEFVLDWFSRRTSSESLGYNSSRQEDILRAFLKKMKATAILNEDHRK